MSWKFALVTSVLCLLASATGRAAPIPDSFSWRVKDSTVSFAHYTRNPCTSILRRNVATGEVVSLDSQSCIGADWTTDPLVMVDQCVPAGTYEYGFPAAQECYDGSDFFEATVTAELGACTRTVPAPAAYEKSVPWDKTKMCKTGCSASGVAAPGGVLLALGALMALCRRSRR